MKNLFDYATKELSQDAFLRWLFENYDCDDKNVCLAAYSLLREFSKLDMDYAAGRKVTELETFAQFPCVNGKRGKMDIIVKFT
ncbi:hypothetical protein SAMN02910447_02632 [Ruminococcus sp. YE71]|uniref:hypothetical protein n=1 Tax=unclassified Ruminococcus TaxID=2608920 RepID=UPI00088747E3|nr:MULTISPECIES: hypothetical protein [unclassified Ruminococcus]SDA24790.1 hypothetical protein SAMN02910446_02428 [Ruminococcus sp. YE78]SFW43510.1 hypothetical protein SAMN02910447_02632 [Ruminococcus sp. YE71]